MLTTKEGYKTFLEGISTPAVPIEGRSIFTQHFLIEYFGEKCLRGGRKKEENFQIENTLPPR